MTTAALKQLEQHFLEMGKEMGMPVVPLEEQEAINATISAYNIER